MKNNFYILAVCVLLAACNNKTTVTEPEANKAVGTRVTLTNEQLVNGNVTIGSMVKGDISEYITANGLIEVPPQYIATVSAKAPGFVQGIEILPGSYVQKGQVLTLVENNEFLQWQQNYVELLAQLTLTEQEYVRQKTLREEDVNAVKTYQTASSEYTVLKSKVSAAEKKLQMLGFNTEKIKNGELTATISIKSPIAGYVKTVNVNTGKYVNTADAMFEVIDPSHKHIELNVFEKDAARLREGQKIKFKLSSSADKEYDATVYLINKAMDIVTKTVTIHAHSDKDFPEFIPGLYVEAKIITQPVSAYLLNKEAIIIKSDSSFVYILKSNSKEGSTFELQPIKTGIESNGKIQILTIQKLSDSTKVVLSGAYYLQAESMKGSGEEE